MILLIDFDGTLVEHDYPRIGEPVPNALFYLSKFQQLGCKLILWTVRDGFELQEAINYCEKYGIKFWGINKNPQQFTTSPKPDHTLLIDDRAFGVPLMESLDENGRQIVNWDIVGPAILKMLEV